MTISQRVVSWCCYGAALAALIAAMLACASPFGTSAGVVAVEPDPAVTVSPDDMKAAGEVVKNRLTAADLYHGMEVTDSRLTIHLTRAEDIPAVTALATTPGVLEIFRTNAHLEVGTVVTDDIRRVDTDKEFLSVEAEKGDSSWYIGFSLNSLSYGAPGGSYQVIAQDGIVVCSMTITSAVWAHRGSCSGPLSDETSVKLLVAELKGGALPIQLRVVSTGPNTP